LVDAGEFANRADIITAALRFWFNYRKFDVRAAVIEFLRSDEGMDLIREAGKKKK